MTSLQATVCDETAKACCRAFGPHLKAIVLTGSLARDEATCIAHEDGAQVLGDAEFFLVFEARAPLPSRAALDPVIGKIERRLGDLQLRCPVELSAVHPEYFRRLRPAIFAYELRQCGRVVWGDPAVLSLIPAFSDIPGEDAWRLLMNRLIECLEALPDSPQTVDSATERLHYRLIKLYLDMATSFLVFAGGYRPTYRARAERLAQMAEPSPQPEEFPLPMQAFSAQVAACTEFKLSGGKEPPMTITGGAGGVGRALWPDAVDHARRLWRWELMQLTGAPSTSANRELMERWMSLQPVRRRLRGWLVVGRECGWFASARYWPRWMGLARRASPRYWIYAAASELFFSLSNDSPSLGSKDGRGEAGERSWSKITATLPMIPPATSESDSVEQAGLASAIADNYHRFVEHTTS